MKRLSALIFVLGCLSWARVASAQTLPAACTSTRDAMGYRAGYFGGGSLVRQAWARVNDCDRVDDVAAAVQTVLASAVPSSSATSYLTCRFSGLTAGALAEIDGLFTTCADECYLEGQIAGEITAFAYCELSILLGGLGVADWFVRGPVQTCGLSFEIGCDENFETTAISYRNALGQCLPYTRDPFTDVFLQTQYNQCAYEPIPPDPSDPSP